MAARAQTAPIDRSVPRSRARPSSADRPPASSTEERRRSAERRRRARHFAQLRRDLTVDAVAGLIAALLLITLTAGLGVLALLVVPLVISLLASGWLERRHRRTPRPGRTASPTRRAPGGGARRRD